MNARVEGSKGKEADWSSPESPRIGRFGDVKTARLPPEPPPQWTKRLTVDWGDLVLKLLRRISQHHFRKGLCLCQGRSQLAQLSPMLGSQGRGLPTRKAHLDQELLDPPENHNI